MIMVGAWPALISLVCVGGERGCDAPWLLWWWVLCWGRGLVCGFVTLVGLVIRLCHLHCARCRFSGRLYVAEVRVCRLLGTDPAVVGPVGRVSGLVVDQQVEVRGARPPAPPVVQPVRQEVQGEVVERPGASGDGQSPRHPLRGRRQRLPRAAPFPPEEIRDDLALPEYVQVLLCDARERESYWYPLIAVTDQLIASVV